MSKSVDEASRDIRAMKSAMSILTLSSQTDLLAVQHQLDNIQSLLSPTSTLATEAAKTSEVLIRLDTEWQGIKPSIARPRYILSVRRRENPKGMVLVVHAQLCRKATGHS